MNLPESGMDETPRLWFVLVNYNGLDDTLECLRSLSDAGVPLQQVVVVDNASRLRPNEAIEEAFPSVVLFNNAENQGWAGGNNRGIEIAIERGADWVFLLNNDTTVRADIMERMLSVLQGGQWDVVGPLINEYSEPDVIQSEGVAFNRKDGEAFFSSIPVSEIAANQSDVVSSDIVNGCAVAFSRQVIEKIGLIDERFFLICEESDFCLRANEAGFRVGVLADSLVFHKHSVSFARAGKPLQRYYGTRNLRLLLKKHAGGSERRNRFQSWLLYHRHAFHLFCHERELDNRDGARAVINGVVDSWLGRYGVQRTPVTALAFMGESLFYLGWRLRGGRVAAKPVAT